MMDFTPTPESVAARYQKGVSFNNGIDLYDTVSTNEDFFVGKQWEGVKSNGLPTPVFNFLKRVVLFSVANVSTDNLKLHANPMPSSSGVDKQTLETLSSILNDQFLALFESNKMGAVIREFCRNAAVDGDGCTFSWFDPDEETGQDAKGIVRTEVLKNTQVLFGNPNNRDVQSQPYLIIERRMMVSEARKRARRYGADETDTESIIADESEGENSHMDELGGDKVTVLVYLWKDDETGHVHSYECTKSVELRADTDLGISLYPLTWMPWVFVHDCYLGQAMITGLIPNQIQILNEIRRVRGVETVTALRLILQTERNGKLVDLDPEEAEKLPYAVAVEGEHQIDIMTGGVSDRFLRFGWMRKAFRKFLKKQENGSRFCIRNGRILMKMILESHSWNYSHG